MLDQRRVQYPNVYRLLQITPHIPWGETPSLKSVTYSTITKLGTVIPYTYINHVTNPVEFSTFSPEISHICYIKKYR